MKRKINVFPTVIIAAVMFLAGLAVQAQRYSGQAAAVRSTVTVPLLPVTTAAVADTGPLPSAGGTISLTSAGVNVPSVLTVGSSNVSTSGTGNLSQSIASVDNLNIGALLNNSITADVVSSTTQSACPGGLASGSSTIANLQINGLPITIDGTPNQTITLLLLGVPVGTLVINEQITSPGSITVNALHISVIDPGTLTATNIVVASAHSDITCVAIPPVNRYSGRSTDVRLTQTTTLPTTVTGTIIADTGSLPTSGGSILTTTAGAGSPPLLTTGTVSASSSGGLPGGNENTSQSNASVNNLSINALASVSINATVLNSNTQCQCTISVPSCSGTSSITNLSVTALGLPFPIIVTGSPNQPVTLPAGLGTLIINEQTSAGAGDITVNALHINLAVPGLAATEIIISSAHSDIACAAPPTAADASVSGRVTTLEGRGIPRAKVKLTNINGTARHVFTNNFGYYRFAAVPSGHSYTAEVDHKRYGFLPQLITIKDDIAGLDFIAEAAEANAFRR